LPQDNISDGTLKKLKKYMDNPKFVPEIVEKTSKVDSLKHLAHSFTAQRSVDVLCVHCLSGL
jgi:hypothetical protein